jgi:hypothetical protein
VFPYGVGVKGVSTLILLVNACANRMTVLPNNGAGYIIAHRINVSGPSARQVQ